ncbi:hypothetical protein HPB47_000327 [Ixodes persulcatus]|uniref:Uncharacterized protein n=1 Tax=Ixodes persulcatus TaxID=34615 RepID=A0AC60PS28_IXOPE|nr:hypothetical protein HPB47_000327 [Ixodes persulcatus]
MDCHQESKEPGRASQRSVESRDLDSQPHNFHSFVPLSRFLLLPLGVQKQRGNTSGRLARAGRNAAASTTSAPCASVAERRLSGAMPFDATARLSSAAVAAGSAGPQSRSGCKLDDSAGVCRMLFDAPQRDQLCRVVVEQLRSEQTARSKTWNYDFAKELPAEGRYEWVGTTERVHQGTERPAVSCCKRQTKLTVELVRGHRGLATAIAGTRRPSVGSELAQWPLAPRASRSLGGLPRIRTRTGRRRADCDHAPGSDHGNTGERAEGAESSGLQEPLTSKRAPRKCTLSVRPPLILDSETSTSPRLWYECHPRMAALDSESALKCYLTLTI